MSKALTIRTYLPVVIRNMAIRQQAGIFGDTQRLNKDCQWVVLTTRRINSMF